MIEEIGNLWQEGELYASGKDYHNALLYYQRAKAFLIAESKAFNQIPITSSTDRFTKILGNIMERLTKSIEFSNEELKKDPTLTLGLCEGYTKSDLKSAYRKYALKYHPDKNQDCDTSCIFTAVQSAYEKLKVQVASDSVAQDFQRAQKKSTQKSQNPPKSNERCHKKQPDCAVNADVPSRPLGKAATTGDSAHPSVATKLPRVNSATKRCQSSYVASDASGLTSQQLRSIIRNFGFTGDIDSMPREELLRKYFALNAHIAAAKRRAQAGRGTQHDEEFRKEFGPTGQRLNGGVQKDLFSGAERDAKGPEAKAEGTKRPVQRPEVPLADMGISQLRALMRASNVDDAGCLEKADLLRRLETHFGPRSVAPPEMDLDRLRGVVQAAGGGHRHGVAASVAAAEEEVRTAPRDDVEIDARLQRESEELMQQCAPPACAPVRIADRGLIDGDDEEDSGEDEFQRVKVGVCLWQDSDDTCSDDD